MIICKKKENKFYVTIFLENQILPAVLQDVKPAKNGCLPIKFVERGFSSLLFSVTEIYLTPNPNRSNTRRLTEPHLLGTSN